VALGHDISVVYTSRSEDYYDAKESDFRSLAERFGAAFFNDTKINEQANVFLDHGCDIAVSINCLNILNKPLLGAFKFGVLNAHAGDLPRYRGNACPNWAILNGEKKIALTVHQMVEELDAGPVLLKKYMGLDDRTYIGDIYAWIEDAVPGAMAEAVEGLVTGKLTPEPQTAGPAAALRCYPRRPEDSRLDWDWPEDRIMRLIRASSRPFCGAYTSLEGNRKVTIWKAEPYKHPGPYLAMPGQVCLSDNGFPIIACGDGMIRLTDFDVEGVETGDASKVVLSSLRNRLI